MKSDHQELLSEARSTLNVQMVKKQSQLVDVTKRLTAVQSDADRKDEIVLQLR